MKEIFQPGEVLCIDESMIKAFHRNLAGKMKIIRKPRPVGNELKTVCDGKSEIVSIWNYMRQRKTWHPKSTTRSLVLRLVVFLELLRATKVSKYVPRLYLCSVLH